MTRLSINKFSHNQAHVHKVGKPYQTSVDKKGYLFADDNKSLSKI